jgi:hypothetical protein
MVVKSSNSLYIQNPADRSHCAVKIGAMSRTSGISSHLGSKVSNYPYSMASNFAPHLLLIHDSKAQLEGCLPESRTKADSSIEPIQARTSGLLLR